MKKKKKYFLFFLFKNFFFFFVLEESEVLKVTAATANRLHVVLSALEVQKRTVTT